MKREYLRHGIMMTVIMCTLALLVSCGSGGGGGGDDVNTATIALSVSPSIISADGRSSATVTAAMSTSSGAAVPKETSVTLSTTLGSFRNGSKTYRAETPDDSGSVTVSLIAGTIPGISEIVASANNVTQKEEIVLAGADAITLTATPDEVTAGAEGSTSTISAFVTDVDGRPVDGEEIRFSLTPAVGSLSSATVTTSSGLATTEYTPPSTAGAVTITAEASNDRTETVIVTVLPGLDSGSISVAADPASIPADGSSTSLVTATLQDNAGDPLVDLPVTFSKVFNPLPQNNTYSGTGTKVTSSFHSSGGNTTFTMNHDGESNFIVWLWRSAGGRVALLANEIGAVDNLETLEELDDEDYLLEVQADGDWSIQVEGDIAQAPDEILGTIETDASGEAQITYTSTIVKGAFMVQATSGELSDSVTITQTAGTPAQIGVSAKPESPDSIYANGINRWTISATVRDAHNNLVEDGTSVNFSATSGTIGSTATTDGGVATTALTSVSSATTVTSTVTALVDGLTDTTTVDFVGVTLTDMAATPAAIFVNNTSTITVRLRDSNGIAVQGETIAFTTTGGTLETQTTTTGEDGVASVVLIAPVEPGSGTVTASYGLRTADTDVSFHVNPSGAVVVSAASDSIVADGSSQVLITASVSDSSGNSVADGTAVTFRTTAGRFVDAHPWTSTVINATTTNGEATAMLISSTNVGTATITAASGGVSGTAIVNFISAAVNSISLVAMPNNLTADGASVSTIRVLVKDAYGNVVNNETISFSVTTTGTTPGTLSSRTATTADGVASVIYTASTEAGNVDTVRAEATNGSSASASITLIEPLIGSVNCEPGCNSIVVGGNTEVMISATILDSNGNNIADGTVVTFITTAGDIDSTTPGTQSTFNATTTNSVATAMLTSPDKVGTATIKVIAGGVCCTTTVAFVSGPVSSLSVTATPNSLLADGSSTSTIKAVVTDAYGNAVDGETISFSLTAGTGTLSAPTAITSDGAATVTYTASTTSGLVTITAEAGNQVAPATVDITLIDASKVPTQIYLGTSQVTVQSDNSDSAIVTAAVLDANNVVVKDVTVAFSTTGGGQLSVPFDITDANGQAEVEFSSGPDATNRTVTITASVVATPPLVAQIPIQVVGSTLTLSTDNTVVTNDGATTATLTITAKNASGTPVYNTPITLSVSGTGGATLSAYSGNTDVSGQMEVTVTGTSEGTVTVTAEGLGVPATQDYTVVGSAAVFFRIVLPETDSISWATTPPGAVAITGPSNQIAFFDNDPNQDTITRTGHDFAGDGFKAGDRIMVGGSLSNDGVYEIAAVALGELTLIATDALTTEAAGESITVTNGVLVRVEAPAPTTSVRFAATFGVWDTSVSSVIVKPVINDFASAVFSSTVAGLATVHVADEDEPSRFDQLEVVVSAPSAEAAHITLQSSTYVVPPSVGSISQEAILTASVRTSSATGRQPVGGAPVAFSIKNQTGGGETVFPVVVFTDDSGVATTTFTSGALSSGAEGVSVTATVLGEGETGQLTTISFHDTDPATITRSDTGPPDNRSFVDDGFEAGELILVEGSESNDGNYIIASVTDDTLTLEVGENLTTESAAPGRTVTITALGTSVNIVIGGTAGSIVIGRGSQIQTVSPTTYSLPMSVLVSDSNGNPVSGANVSLSAWPSFYSTGVWQHREQVTIDPTTGIVVTSLLDECDAFVTGTYLNEDLNENLFLDPGEDTGSDPGHGDGQLTPPNSAAGNVPMGVTTDQFGVANFDLVYMKSSAIWIVDRIRASTLVLGTETTSSMTFTLPAEEQEAEGCDLPDSPYNTVPEVAFVRLTALDSGGTPVVSLPADGTSTATIVAEVFDKSGVRMPGEVLVFDMLTGTGSISPPSATTDSFGVAEVLYTTSTIAGVEIVRATAAGGVSGTVEINLAGSSVPDKVSLATSQISVKSDNSDSATITATVLDADNVVLEGQTVTFSADGGQLSASFGVTDANGQAEVIFSSGTVDPTSRTVTITALVAGLAPAQIPVRVVGSTLTLNTDNNIITSDGSTTATLTITAANAGGIPVYNTPITLSVSGAGDATLSTYAGNTDINGLLEVVVTGASPGSVTVTAEGLGVAATQDYTVILAGVLFFRIGQPTDDAKSWNTIDPGPVAITESSLIAFTDNDPAADTITRSDGGNFNADGFNDGDRITVGGSLSNDTDTDVDDPLFYTIDTVTNTTLTLVASDELTDEPTGSTVIITNGVLVRVVAPPPTTRVRFATTFGTLTGTDPAETGQVMEQNVSGGVASAVFSSNLAGVATIHVSDEDNPSYLDSLNVVVSAPTADSAHITLQSNTYVVPISVGGISNTATLTASVRTSSATGRQPVGGAPVAFSIMDQTGGGETIFPVIVLTDSSGVATTTFTSGSLSSGAEGVRVTATVLDQGTTGSLTTISFDDNDPNRDTITRSDPGSFLLDGFQPDEQIHVEGSEENDGNYIVAEVTANTLTLYPGETLITENAAGRDVTITAVSTSVNIVIGGTAGSLVIGRGSEVTVLSDTTYSLPMSVLVADSNGNPIPGAVVSLSAWPSYYSTGNWRHLFDLDPTTGLVIWRGSCEDDITGTYLNEDLNENLFLDPGEDTGSDPGHGDGQLTPPNSAGGTVPMAVTTDQNGVANFDLVYPKSSAVWIIDRIRASTLVLGTETTSSMSFRLPPQLSEALNCKLPPSPYNTEQPLADILLTATPDELLADGRNESQITAIVTDSDGNPAPDGMTVSFSIVVGTGEFDTGAASASDETVGGVASVTYRASETAGTVTIQATPSGATLSRTVDITLVAPVASIVLTATPNQLLADGRSQSTIGAVVRDGSGNLALDGERINFTISGPGTFGGFGITSWDYTVGGVASVTYEASEIPGTATIEATAESDSSVLATVPITLTAPRLDSVTVTAGSDTIMADGSAYTLISAEVLDSAGNEVADLTVVDFATTAGTLSNVTTTVNGVATARLTSSTTMGTATVTAIAEGISDSVTVTFIPGPIDTVSVTATPNNLTADNSSTSQIMAVVRDAQGNPVKDETIRFDVNSGTIIPVLEETDDNGMAMVTYTASNAPGAYTIMATATNGESGTTTITLIAIQIGSVSVQAGQNELIADGVSNTTITATVLDSVGNSVPDNTTVSFTNDTAYGTLSAGTAQTFGGAASVILTSPTESGHAAFIRVDAGGLIGSTTIDFIPGPVHRIVAEANPQTIPAVFAVCPDDSSRIIATVLDKNNNPVSDGSEVVFSLDRGWIWENYPLCSVPLPVTSSQTVETANGVARIAIVGGDLVETGTVDICVEGVCYEDASGERGLQVAYGGTTGEASGLPASIELELSVPNIQVKGTGGKESATLIARVYDEIGSPIKDSYTGGDGSTSVGLATFVSASAQFITRGFSAGDTLSINTGADNGDYSILSVDSETQVTLDQLMTETASDLNFTATIKDNITFSILLGPGGGENIDGQVVTSTKSTINGEASATISSGSLPGVVTIRVVCAQGGKTATATSPPVGIEAGPAAVISLYPTGVEIFNDNGTNTRSYYAIVQDRFSNPVPDGITVYFGLVDNESVGLGLGYKTAGSAGVATQASNIFTATGANFQSNGVVTGDSLVITEAGSNVRGGYIIDSVDSETQVTLFKSMSFSGTSLDFVAGSAEFGVISGVQQTGNTFMSGIVETTLTYPRVAGDKPVTIYCQTSGFDISGSSYNLGTTLTDVYSTTTAPRPDSVTVTAGSDSIVADGSAQTLITATVQDSSGNNVADGTTVTFMTTAGEFLGAPPLTPTVIGAATTHGVATAWLVSPTNVGAATITATAGGAIGNTVVTFIASAVDAISLTATPNNLTADGLGTSTIQAFVTDANGNAVDGETITFSVTTTGTTAGTLSAQTATTTNGIATVIYTASTEATNVDTVRAEATNSAIFDTATITLIDIVVAAVSVSAGSDTAVADGSAQTLITATVQDSSGSNAADGTTVTFTTTAGEFLGALPLTPTVIDATTTNGVATATLTSATNVGIATIIATCGGVTDSTAVTFIPGAVAAISVTAAPNNLTADGTSTSTIRAFVTDANNNAVDDEVISFSVTSGTGILSSPTATTSGGVATVTYTASTTPGNETVTVEATNGTSSAANITLIGVQIGSIVLSANPTSLPADGASEATISAAITLVGGGDAPDGTTVSFSIVSEPAFTLVPSSITATASTAAGVATAFLTSSDGVGWATIRAAAGGRTAEIDVEYTPGSLTLTIVPNSLLGTGEETATVTATLKDQNGLPPPAGETVYFTLDDLSLGSITASATSNANGEAVGVFQELAKGGTVTVTGTWTTLAVDVTGSGTIDIQPPPAFIENAEGSPAPAAINIKGTGGQSTSLITFDVKDSAGNLVTDGYQIDFSLDSGPNGGENLVPLSARTTDGQVNTILYSGFKSGPVSIRAKYHHDTNISTTTSQIAISGGPPVGEEFGVFAEYLNISGLWMANLQNSISINAGDVYGNAIPDDTAISFKTYNTGGFFTPNTATTVDGIATNILHSAGTYLQPLEGFVSITAEAINGGRTTHVTSLAVTPSPNNHIIYAGTDGGGVYKSTNSGATWQNISRSSENSKVGQNWIDPHVKGNSAISVDPDDHTRLYVGTGYLGRGNLYRSLDGGMNWNSNNAEEWNGIFATEEAVLTVLCDDGGSDYIWIGTEGLGALFATDGESFQWGGIATAPTDPAPPNTGDGTMSQPTLTASSQTETWTATYQVSGATASTPAFNDVSGAGADGTMTGVSATAATATETWTMTYTGGVSIGYGVATQFPPALPGNVLTVLSTSATTFSETWTVTCVNNATPGSEVFSVVSSASGIHPQATANVNYTSGNQEITFLITGTAGTWVLGDFITFTTTRDGWSVAGSVSLPSPMTNVARTGTAYTSDNAEVSFTITPGTNRFYQTGDIWTFNTSITGDWEVVGTVSGTQFRRAQNNQRYTSDNYEVTFTIFDGATTPYDAGDDFTFGVTESGLGYGKIVRDMVKVPGTNGSTAELFAGTNTGVFRSTDGGLIWNPVTSFTGDFITTLALHPTIANVIYAGTEDAGVWVSTDSGVTWTAHTSGMGKGLSATIPMADPNNEGNGVMSEVTVGAATLSEYWSATCNQAASATTPVPGVNIGNGTMSAVTVDPTNTVSENWTVTCIAAAVDGGIFSVTGSVSGLQGATASVGTSYTSDGGEVSFTISDGAIDFSTVPPDSFTFSTTGPTTFSVTGSVSGAQADATVGVLYTSLGGEVSFTISDGITDFEVGDSFTFSTTKDPGRTIKDLLVVTDNAPATNNDQLYAITYFWGPLEPHAVGNIYAHALDDTTADMQAGANWGEANSGLPQYDPPDDTTLFAQHVMALDVSVSPTALYVGGEGINLYKAGSAFAPVWPALPDPPWQESKSGLSNLIMARMPVLFSGICDMDIIEEQEGSLVTFTVYIQDVNGNPPIEGSTLLAKFTPLVGDEVTLLDLTYTDSYVHAGTFRDPGDPSTNIPYRFFVDVGLGGEVSFTFTPTCKDEVPGCSGSEQEERFLY